MKTVIVYDHPYPGSYCHSILQAVVAGLQQANHEIDIIDLNTDGFNPVMTLADLNAFRHKAAIAEDVIAYQARVQTADQLIFIFPIWWELMPALTKGFIERVMFPGFAYDDYLQGTKMSPRLTQLKKIRIITTMNTPLFVYRFKFGNAIKKALVSGTFKSMGYRDCQMMQLSLVKFVSQKQRERWLEQVTRKFAKN